MRDNPLISHPLGWIGVVAACIAGICVHASLLTAYCQTEIAAAAIDGAVSTLSFVALALLAWPVASHVNVGSLRFYYLLLSLTIWLGLGLATSAVCSSVWQQCCTFAATAPFRLMFGVPMFGVVFLVYEVARLKAQATEASEHLRAAHAETPAITEYLTRITIKDNGKIHLVETAELTHIQAFGDYAKLFTRGTSLLKEQTMKDFEAQLNPQQFVRIHRSYIVNVAYISRVELYGKESYRVILKDNTTLPSSLNGYRLLKEKLLI